MGDYEIKASVWVPAGSENEAVQKFVGKFKDTELLLKIEEVNEMD